MEMINFTQFIEYNKKDYYLFEDIFKTILRNIRIDKIDNFYYNLNNENLYISKELLNSTLSFIELNSDKYVYLNNINFDKYIVNNDSLKFNIKKENFEYDMFKEKLFIQVRETFKKFKNLNDLLKTRKTLDECYKNYKNDKVSSIDIEYTKIKGKFLITEIGYTIKDKKQKKLMTKHFYIKENLEYVKKRKFLYGFSEIKKLKETLREVEKDFKDVKLITGNNIDEDIKFLRMFGLSINNSKVIDLSEFFKFFYKDHEKRNLKLSSLTRVLSDKQVIPHNAGNDAYYGIQNFCKLINSYNNNTYEEIVKKLNIYENEKCTISEMSIVNNLNNRKVIKLKNLCENNNLKPKILPKEKVLEQELISISRTIPFIYNSFVDNKPEEIDFKFKIESIYNNLRNENKMNVFLTNTNHNVVTDINSYCVFLQELKHQFKDINYDFDLFIPSNFCIIKENDINKEVDIELK